MAEMESEVAELSKQDRKVCRDTAALAQRHADLRVRASSITLQRYECKAVTLLLK